jgi:hypothetical protein
MIVQGQSKSMITLQKFRDFEEAESIRLEWDQFVEMQTADIFLSYDWCRIWWKYYGKKREPLLFVFWNDAKICGILPMFRERIRLGPLSVNIVRLMCTDYSPVTVSLAVRTEFLNEVILQLLEELRKINTLDILYFGALCGRYPDTDILTTILKNHLGQDYRIETRESDVQTYFCVEPDLEKQLSTMNKNNRKMMRRIYKLIQERGLDLHSTVATIETLPDMFDGLVKTHQAQWNEIGMPGHFIVWPMAIQYHREMAEAQARNGRLRLMEIWLSEVPIGYLYMYKFGDTYLDFISGRFHFQDENKITFHRTSFGEVLKLANTENVQWIDAMRGSYEYKEQLGGKILPVKNLIVYLSKGGHNVKIHIIVLTIWLLNILYFKIWRRRIMPRIGIRNRHFLDLWVRAHFLVS